ncbi:MAG: LysM peptidoglycan-binding domain-containing protein [Planctomycetaceae bacterium]
MAGNPQPTPRRAPPVTTQADGLAPASREAAAANWGVTPKKSGVRGEVKLALMLILTLSGAFGYIVHRKFQVLRNEVVAAEGDQFHPLVKGDPRKEIRLPSAELSDPVSPGADPHWATHDMSQQAANSPPPVLAVMAAAPGNVTTPSEPFPTEKATTAAVKTAFAPAPQTVDTTGQLPFPEMASQTEPGGATAVELPWSPSTAEPGTADISFQAAAAAPVVEGQSVQPPFPQAEAPLKSAASVANAETPAPRVAVAEAIPFTAASVPVPPAADRAREVPVDLFGELPAGSGMLPQTEPTFSPEAPSVARTPEPAFAEPSFVPPVDTATAAAEPPPFTPLAGDDPFGSPTKLGPPQPVVDGPVTIQPTLEPAPQTADAPRPLFDQPATSTPSPAEFSPLSAPRSEPSVPASAPLFGAPPPSAGPQSGDAVPWSGSPMSAEPSLARDPFPAPASPEITLQQPIATTPVLSGEPAPSLTRTAEPATPAWPEPQPTLARERSLFDDPREPSATEPTEFAPTAAAVPAPFATPTPAASELTASAPTPLTAQPTGGETLYTIRPGDNYWTIARSQYGSVRYFAALTEYNRDRIPDPQKMRPGLQVALPEATLLESQYPQLFIGPAPSITATRPTVRTDGPGEFFVSAGEPHYRVGEGDTLSSIAQKHLGRASRWEQVYTMNRDVLPSADRLKPGTVIRLPRDASQISVTPNNR